VESIQEAEEQLSGLEWLVRGQGIRRKRSYETCYPIASSDLLAKLGTVISKHKVLGSFVSSTGIGQEMLVGSVDKSTFTAKFYSPIDVTVLPMTQVTVWGEAVDLPTGGSRVRMSVRPAVGGLWEWVFGGVIGIAILLFGIFQFAVQYEWKSFAISVCIAVVFFVVPPLLLWWAVIEGRKNERQLLERLHNSILQN
jgi:hypothetical protein